MYPYQACRLGESAICVINSKFTVLEFQYDILGLWLSELLVFPSCGGGGVGDS